ncbi:hypothetical protein D3C78_1347390 [compost metagenome]
MILLSDGKFILVVKLIIQQKILCLQQILRCQGIMVGIKPGGRNGCITDTVDNDKATITAGPRDPTYTTTASTRGGGTTGCRGFKVFGRIDPFQYGFLQGCDFRREILVLCGG